MEQINTAVLESDKKHWSDEEECIKSNRPLKLALSMIKHTPTWLIMFLMYPVVFFYYLFVPRAREDAKLYQYMLRDFVSLFLGRLFEAQNAMKMLRLPYQKFPTPS